MPFQYRLYSSSDPPPVELIRIPQFLQLLVDALFKPGAKLNQVMILGSEADLHLPAPPALRRYNVAH